VTSPQPFTDKVPDGIPTAEQAAALARERLAAGAAPLAAAAALAAEYPPLGLLAPVPVLAEWLGMSEQSIYAGKTRKRSDGQLVWPKQDDTILGRQVWRFATVIVHRATAPGRGWNLRTENRGGAGG